jgi:hypothetical protein
MTSSSSVQALIRVCLVLGLRRQCQLLPAIMISVTTTRLSLRRPTATPHTRLLFGVPSPLTEVETTEDCETRSYVGFSVYCLQWLSQSVCFLPISSP